jgi:hypothetical protein
MLRQKVTEKPIRMEHIESLTSVAAYPNLILELDYNCIFTS